MLDPKLQTGLLFNQLPKLLFIASNLATSDSDAMVKVARISKSNPNISHDEQIFRKIRSGALDEIDLESYLDIGKLNLQIPNIKDSELPEVGSWLLIKAMVAGLKAHNTHQADKYKQFIEAHCELEQLAIRHLLKEKDFTYLQKFLKDWLLVTSFDNPNPTPQQGASYLIKLTMYWGAMIELYLELELESKNISFLSYSLPYTKIRSGSSKLQFSSRRFLELILQGWAEENYSKNRITKNQFYRDILRKQIVDLTLNPSKDLCELELIDPDIDAIKKRFQRWENAQVLFSYDDVKKYLAILRTPYSENDLGIWLAPYLLINLFTYMQKELLSSGISPTQIEREFSEYPKYKTLVSKRYKRFNADTKLSP
ncbi:hypothetical protein C2869_19580 [Saccharobesus litoralis]|uniref:Uncharacterized protein n=1 Tax=Saccharobesus litoralis TaxID=2172099 RepID=A0A2S0VW72_9ALTE|nr:hypothetical protein [Saccharobesus litoralis]AWB68469.1 hypothetical protein C2869_19580 [Saccharobesus litoralis]